MLRKIAFRNAKRQARAYVTYFLTLLVSLSLIHGLHCLFIADDDVFPISNSSFLFLMLLISLLLLFILAWLTNYMTNFMLARRSKEIAIYIILGMDPHQISTVFLIENLIISSFALLFSFAGGGFVYQLLKATTFNLVGEPYKLTFSFTPLPYALTFFYFLLTFGFSSIRSIVLLYKLQPKDLLQFDAPHTIPSTLVIRRSYIFTPLSILCLFLSGYFFVFRPFSDTNSFTFGLLFSLLSLWSFFHYFPLWLSNHLDKSTWKYHHIRLIVLRAFTAKLNDLSQSFTFIASVFTIALSLIAIVGIAISAFDYRLTLVPFSFSIITNQDQDHMSMYDSYIKQNFKQSRSVVYSIYQSDSTVFASVSPSFTLYNVTLTQYSDYDLCMSYSDYAAIRTLLGYPPVQLEGDSYVIHCLPSCQKAFSTCAEQHLQLEIGGNSLAFSGIYTEPFDQYDGYSNGEFFIIIIPDSIAKKLPVYYKKCSVLLDVPFTNSQYEQMSSVFPNLLSLRSNSTAVKSNSSYTDYIDIRSDIQEENGILYATSILPALYVAIILAITGFTVIASNVMCEDSRMEPNFRLLKSLGYSQNSLEKIIFYPIIIIFAIPLLFAYLLSSFIAITYAYSFGALFFVPISALVSSFILSSSIFTLLYSIYFVICFTTLRRDIIFKY